MNAQIVICIVTLAAVVVLFLLEPYPLPVTALLVALVLCLTNILTPAEAFAGFVNNSVILFAGMFVISGAMFKTGMAHRIASLVTRFGANERQLIVAVYLLGGLMSAVLPNLGTMAVLIPIVAGIADQGGYKRSHLLMTLLCGTTIGGQMTLLGTAGNAVIASALNELGINVGFFAFTTFGLPMFLAGGLFYGLIGYRMLPTRETNLPFPAQAGQSPENGQAWKQYLSLAALMFVLFCAMFDVGIPLHIAAVIGAVFLLVTRTVDENTAISSINWKAIFLIGGMLSMSTALAKTGSDELIARAVIHLLGDGPSPLMITAVVWWLSNILSQFMSNTAVMLMLTPIGIAIAQNLQVSPTAVLMAVLTGCSVALLTPVASAQNTMIYEMGGFKFKDYFSSGIWLTLICFITCVILLPIIFPFY